MEGRCDKWGAQGKRDTIVYHCLGVELRKISTQQPTLVVGGGGGRGGQGYDGDGKKTNRVENEEKKSCFFSAPPPPLADQDVHGHCHGHGHEGIEARDEMMGGQMIPTTS